MNNFFFEILFCFGCTVIILSFFMLVRNHFVYRERMRLLGLVSGIARKKLSAGQEWEYLYQKFEAKGYDRMMYENPFRFKWDLDYFEIYEIENVYG